MTEANDRLFIEAAATLREAAQQQQPTLNPEHIETLLRAVVRLMDKYDGPEDTEAFIKWALTIVKPGADLLRALSTLTGEHVEEVRRAIRKVLAVSADLGVDSFTLREIEARVWARIFETLPRWLTPSYSKTPGRSPAKLKTRLYAYAYLVALGWQKEQLRHREKHVPAITLEKPIDYKPSEKYRVVLGPGDTGAYDPEPSAELEAWEIPIESENIIEQNEPELVA